jgi:ribose transport system substrate-binding protein
MIESLVAQGFNAMLVFPGDAVGTNAMLAELAGFNIPSIALAGCTKDPSDALFCMGTDVARSAYLGTKELIAALGGKGGLRTSPASWSTRTRSCGSRRSSGRWPRLAAA